MDPDAVITEFEAVPVRASAPLIANVTGKTVGDVVAATTESTREAEIDAANGLRHHGGRKPTPEDFDGILTPEGNSGNVVGTEIADAPYIFGESGSTGATL